MRIFSRNGRFAVLGIQMLNLFPKPLIQVQFLVGTPLRKTRFNWVFRFFRFPRGPGSTVFFYNFPPTESRMEPGPAHFKSEAKLAKSRTICHTFTDKETLPRFRKHRFRGESMLHGQTLSLEFLKNWMVFQVHY